MSTTLIKPPAPAGVEHSPTFGEMLGESLPLIGVVVVAGPPVILLAAPLVLGALMLAGPFAVVATLVLVVVMALVAAAALVALTGAIAATPQRLVRRLGARRTHRARAGRLVAVEPRQGAA